MYGVENWNMAFLQYGKQTAFLYLADEIISDSLCKGLPIQYAIPFTSGIRDALQDSIYTLARARNTLTARDCTRAICATSPEGLTSWRLAPDTENIRHRAGSTVAIWRTRFTFCTYINSRIPGRCLTFKAHCKCNNIGATFASTEASRAPITTARTSLSTGKVASINFTESTERGTLSLFPGFSA